MANKNLLLHIHPVRVDARALDIRYTWGLGGMAVSLFLIQLFTGFLLRFHYEPTPRAAYDSVLMIEQQMIFGQMVRNIHHWSGVFMVIVVFLHLLRVLFTSAFHPPGRANWLIGVGLLLLVLLLNFTGYLLPWDQRSYWAVTVSTEMLEYIPGIGHHLLELVRGGEEVSASTLLNFYAYHTGFLPFLMLVLVIYHFWKIRKAKGLAITGSSGETRYVDTVPELVVRELVFALGLIAFVFLFSIFFDAPMMNKANPAYSPNPAKAPWYFMGIQELMLHFHPVFAVLIIPLLAVTALFLIPWIGYTKKTPGKWFHSRQGKFLSARSAAAGGLFTVIAVIAGEFLVKPETWLATAPTILTEGIIPVVVNGSLIFLVLYLLWRKKELSTTEKVFSLASFFTAAYLVLLVAGQWFRGPGMDLGWYF